MSNSDTGNVRGAAELMFSDDKFKRPYVTPTQKIPVKERYAEKRKAFEAAIRLRIRKNQQVDPLYDKMKKYHDNMLKK